MLIGVGGYAGSGKDTVAKILEDEHGFVNLGSFSVPLNECLLVVNPLVEDGVRYADLFRDCDRYDGYARFKEHPEVRRLLQTFGGDVGRDMIDPDLWVKQMEKRVSRLLDSGQNVVVTSVRYPNEITLVHWHHGMTVWVERPGYGPINEHSSDNSLTPDHFQLIVVNDGTLHHLSEVVSALL